MSAKISTVVVTIPRISSYTPPLFLCCPSSVQVPTCVRSVPSKLRLMRYPDRSLTIPTPDGHIPNAPPHKPFVIYATNSRSSQKKSAVLLGNCSPVRLGAGAVPVPPPAACQPGRRCLHPCARRPACSTSALRVLPGRPPRTWGLIAVRCCHGCDLCRTCASSGEVFGQTRLGKRDRPTKTLRTYK